MSLLALPARPPSRWVFGLLGFGLLLAGLASMSTGASTAGLREVWRTALETLVGLGEGTLSSQHRAILVEIRWPRTLFAALVGAALAVSGALMQGLFRNPLADPGLLGVSGGAALGAAFAIVSADRWLALPAPVQVFLVPLSAFGSALSTVVLVQRIAQRGGATMVVTLLLAGMALSAIASALTGLLAFLANEQQLRSIVFWSLGSLAGARWRELLILTPVVAVAVAAAISQRRVLDLMLLGEAEAAHLGADVEALKRRLVLLVAAMVGASVAFAGVVGFVGLVVPHLMRLLLGPSHRTLLPASALAGAGLVLAADIVARTAFAPAELPIGVVTALLGGPFFVGLLVLRAGEAG